MFGIEKNAYEPLLGISKNLIRRLSGYLKFRCVNYLSITDSKNSLILFSRSGPGKWEVLISPSKTFERRSMLLDCFSYVCLLAPFRLISSLLDSGNILIANNDLGSLPQTDDFQVPDAFFSLTGNVSSFDLRVVHRPENFYSLFFHTPFSHLMTISGDHFALLNFIEV